jgi:hypothetical protein
MISSVSTGRLAMSAEWFGPDWKTPCARAIAERD